MSRDDAIQLLHDLSADNDAMKVGATAFVSEKLSRPAQSGDVGRGDEVSFGSALRALAFALERDEVSAFKERQSQ